ncbi:amidohydrolase family protein [Halomonas sp.]|uniref:amidohydrolase family protein n=1 Tax=unclassified Halomonas TaxID=2609666 RepID=UPI003F8E051D
MDAKQLLIDAHHHLWALDGSVSYPWLEEKPVRGFFLGDYTSIKRPFLVEDLKRHIPKGYHLAGSVHCEAEAHRSQPLKETEWINSVYTDHKLPTAHVGWAEFGTPKCSEQLDAQMNSPLFRGVRAKPVTAVTSAQINQVKGNAGSLQDRQWCDGLIMLEERNLSWDLRVPAWHLSDAAKTLEARPKLRVILNHTGLPWDRTSLGVDTWRTGMRALADNPNVAVKLSELGSPWHEWDYKANLELLCETIDLFGPNRCLFASNFPVSSLAISYADWLGLVEAAISFSAPDYRQNILHDNALHWYRLTN